MTGRQEINDFRVRFFGHDDVRTIAFICECAEPGCRRAVMMTRVAYCDLRAQGKPLLYPSHVPDEDAPLRAEGVEAAADGGGPRSPEALETGN